jgi:predicted acyltransferase
LARRFVLRLTLPFGINAIAAYVLHMVTAGMIGWDLLQAAFEMARPAIGESWAALLPVLLYALFIWTCVDWLRRRDWIVKI